MLIVSVFLLVECQAETSLSEHAHMLCVPQDDKLGSGCHFRGLKHVIAGDAPKLMAKRLTANYTVVDRKRLEIV